MFLPAPSYTYKHIHVSVCMFLLGIQSNKGGYSDALIFALVFGEPWHGEILGQVKLLPAP